MEMVVVGTEMGMVVVGTEMGMVVVGMGMVVVVVVAAAMGTETIIWTMGFWRGPPPATVPR